MVFPGDKECFEDRSLVSSLWGKRFAEVRNRPESGMYRLFCQGRFSACGFSIFPSSFARSFDIVASCHLRTRFQQKAVSTT